MEEQAFKYRIIAQDRVYLCMDKVDLANGATGAFDVIREWDSGDETRVMPEVTFNCPVIIEPIFTQTTSKPDTFARDLEAMAG